MDFFLGGAGEGKRTRQGKYCTVVFAGDARVQTAPFFMLYAMFKLGQLDDPLPHTEDSEGDAAPRSVTDSTEQWVWYIMHMCLSYMLLLLYVWFRVVRTRLHVI